MPISPHSSHANISSLLTCQYPSLITCQHLLTPHMPLSLHSSHSNISSLTCQYPLILHMPIYPHSSHVNIPYSSQANITSLLTCQYPFTPHMSISLTPHMPKSPHSSHANTPSLLTCHYPLTPHMPISPHFSHGDSHIPIAPLPYPQGWGFTHPHTTSSHNFHSGTKHYYPNPTCPVSAFHFALKFCL